MIGIRREGNEWKICTLFITRNGYSSIVGWWRKRVYCLPTENYKSCYKIRYNRVQSRLFTYACFLRYWLWITTKNRENGKNHYLMKNSSKLDRCHKHNFVFCLPTVLTLVLIVFTKEAMQKQNLYFNKKKKSEQLCFVLSKKIFAILSDHAVWIQLLW